MNHPPALVADDPELIRRVEYGAAADSVAIAQAMVARDPASPAASQPWAGGQLIALGKDGFVNRAVATGLEAPVEAADLTVAAEFFAARGLPFDIELCPAAHPSMTELLTRSGATVQWFRQVLARSIVASDAGLADELDVTVVDEALVPQWLAVLRGPDATPEEAAKQDNHALAARAVDTTVAGIVMVEGDVAAAGSVMMREGRADIGAAVTVPPFRNRGLQGALIRWRLTQAARHGCDLAVASADAGSSSARNLERHGFTVLYTQCCVRVSVLDDVLGEPVSGG